MKLILLFILFSLCVGAGLIIYLRCLKKHNTYNELHNFFYTLKNEINYKMISVSDCFYNVKNNYSKDTTVILESIINKKVITSPVIGDKDYNKLYSILNKLGSGDIDSTNSQLIYIINYLESCKSSSKNLLNNKAKAYLKLSFCVGVLLIILLI